jgi:2-methylcitrate dehydratase PrpD
MPTIAESLAAFVADAAPLPPEVIHHAKRAVIDWFACLLPGASLPPATLLQAALADELGHGKAIVYGCDRRAAIRTAALINATASHTIEFDDIFRDAVYHPGCPTIAAALAAGQARGADGLALIRAITMGYEVSTRIGVAVQPTHYDFWHTTGTVGTFGAAAGVAAMLGATAGQTAHALANAATFAAGLQQAFRSDAHAKPLHAGHAADAGAMAALGAAQGITGALDVLEGPAGFGAAMSRNADWHKALDGLGSRWNITQMTFKNHGCCGHCFAAIDGALALQAAHGFTAAEVAHIRIGGYRATFDVTGRKTATTAFEGRFSTPFTVAAALVHGSVRLDAVTPARLADPATQSLAQRVDVVVDPACEAAFPGQRSADVTVTLADGRVLRRLQTTRKGDPDDPLSDTELAAKFAELAGPVLGTARSAALLDRLLHLERQADLALP